MTSLVTQELVDWQNERAFVPIFAS